MSVAIRRAIYLAAGCDPQRKPACFPCGSHCHLNMTVSLSAHFDGKSIVLDEDYLLPPQAKLLVTVLDDAS